MRARALLLVLPLLAGPALASGTPGAELPAAGEHDSIAAPPPPNAFPAAIMERMRAALVALESPGEGTDPTEDTPAAHGGSH